MVISVHILDQQEYEQEFQNFPSLRNYEVNKITKSKPTVNLFPTFCNRILFRMIKIKGNIYHHLTFDLDNRLAMTLPVVDSSLSTNWLTGDRNLCRRRSPPTGADSGRPTLGVGAMTVGVDGVTFFSIINLSKSLQHRRRAFG